MSKAQLYIIDGVSSIWKQDLVQYVEHIIPSSTMIRKFTTRQPRENEDRELLDLEFVALETFGQISPEYTYEYAGYKYGIQRSRLLVALGTYRHVFVIARNSEIIRQLKADFSPYRPVSVFVHMDMHLAANRGLAAGNHLIREAVKKAFSDYLRDPECYDEVLVNGASQNDFFRLLQLLIKKISVPKILLGHTKDKVLFLIVCTRRTRRVVQTLLTITSSITAGFAVEFISGGLGTYWKTISLILDLTLLLSSATIQLLFATCWRELDG